MWHNQKADAPAGDPRISTWLKTWREKPAWPRHGFTFSTSSLTAIITRVEMELVLKYIYMGNSSIRGFCKEKSFKKNILVLKVILFFIRSLILPIFTFLMFCWYFSVENKRRILKTLHIELHTTKMASVSLMCFLSPNVKHFSLFLIENFYINWNIMHMDYFIDTFYGVFF